MKRLIRGEQKDPFLGNPIEVIRLKSKYYGFRGWVDASLVRDKYTHYKYKLFLNPAQYENRDKPHVIYIDYEDIYDWVRLVPVEALEGNN